MSREIYATLWMCSAAFKTFISVDILTILFYQYKSTLICIMTSDCCFSFSVNNKEIQILVTLDLYHPNQYKLDKGQSSSSQSFIIGSVPVAPNLGWSELEVKLQQTFSTYLSNLDTGLKTKKTSRLDPETPSDSLLYTLGLGPSCICEYALG